MPTADPIITQSLCNQIRSPTVDGCEILHQLVVYPSIFWGVQPSQIGGAGLPSTVGVPFLMVFFLIATLEMARILTGKS
jgi:hypothetical protein